MQPVQGESEGQRTIAGGRYRLIAELGSGGMATVWRAYDATLDCERAIKILQASMAAKAKVRQRFNNEARTMAKLSHPNIVTVHDVGSDGGSPYIVMEMLEGGSAMGWIERHGPMPPRMAAELMISVLDALHAAHLSGVIHRDIKPHNVLLTPAGVAKVTDFGIAQVRTETEPHLTRTGMVMGTWAYMAPEQKQSAKQVDARSDVYACAASLFALTSGDEPFDLYATEMRDTVAVKLPASLSTIVAKGSRFRPEDRYQSAKDMADALREALPSLDAIPQGTAPLGQLVRSAPTSPSTTLNLGEDEPAPKREPTPPPAPRALTSPPRSLVTNTSQRPSPTRNAGPDNATFSASDEEDTATDAAAPVPSAPVAPIPSPAPRTAPWALIGGGAVALVVVLLAGVGLSVGLSASQQPPAVAAPVVEPVAAPVTEPVTAPVVTPPTIASPPPVEPTPPVTPPIEPPIVPPVAPAQRPTVVRVPATPAPVAPATPAADLAKVTINSLPYSFVSVDGGATSRTVYAGRFAVGPHKVKFKTADGREATVTVDVTAPETRYCYDFGKGGPC